MDLPAAHIVSDPNWFPMRFDTQSERFQFVRVTPEMHRAVTFLADIRPPQGQAQIVPRSAVAQVTFAEGPLHLILHSGLGGSTLLARALAQPEVVTTLKEPPILTDVVAFGLDGATVERERQLLQDTARLLSRPMSPGEAVVVKMSSIGNGLASAIAEGRPRSQILCLQTPLEFLLASLASRGAEGRLGGRRLFTGMRNARMIAIDLTDEELSERADLELAALAWLSTQRMMLGAASNLGPQRVRSLASERLMAEPREALSAIARHFALALDIETRLASGIFQRHAKTGEPFDAQSRARHMQATLSEHGEEILAVVNWARKVADAKGIAWDLPYPLLD